MPALSKIRSIVQAASALASAMALKQLNQLKEANEEKIAAMMALEDAKLRPVIRGMLMANLNASGLKRDTGTLERAVANTLVDITRKNIFIHLPPGIMYPENKKGNVYAAAGAFRYGAVRQPLTKTHYIDLPTGETRRLKKGRGGQYGQTVKAAIKRVVLNGGHLTEREARGKSGRAMSALAAGQISVIKPRPPFWQLTQEQYKTIEKHRLESAKRIFNALGIPVK